jgi:hypothetical protein
MLRKRASGSTSSISNPVIQRTELDTGPSRRRFLAASGLTTLSGFSATLLASSRVAAQFTPARSVLRSIRRRATSVAGAKWTSAPTEQGGSEAEFRKYVRNRIAEGKLPLCAEMCATRAPLAGDGEAIAGIYRERTTRRGYGTGAWGWTTAYYTTEQAS